MQYLLICVLSLFLQCVSIHAQSPSFSLKSKSLGGQISSKEVFNGFGCNGQNISPSLQWRNIPKGTKSFAITMYDPNAPTGSGWWHWIVFDIPVSVSKIPSNAGDVSKKIFPPGTIQSITDFGKQGYGGPCPPKGHGFHQYIITVYALNVDKLGLDKNANPALVGFYLNSHTIEKTSIISYYKR